MENSPPPAPPRGVTNTNHRLHTLKRDNNDRNHQWGSTPTTLNRKQANTTTNSSTHASALPSRAAGSGAPLSKAFRPLAMLARVTSRASFGEGSPVLPVPAPKNSRSQSVSTSSDPLATARLLQKKKRGDADHREESGASRQMTREGEGKKGKGGGGGGGRPRGLK